MGQKVLFIARIDDTVGVFHTHAVAGVTGWFPVGLFATSEGAAALACTTPGGAVEHNGKQVWLQIVGALFIIGWNIFWTSTLLLGNKDVLRIPLCMLEEQLMIGDDALRGEQAYVLGTDVVPPSLLTGDRRHRPLNGDCEVGIIAVESMKMQEARKGI